MKPNTQARLLRATVWYGTVSAARPQAQSTVRMQPVASQIDWPVYITTATAAGRLPGRQACATAMQGAQVV